MNSAISQECLPDGSHAAGSAGSSMYQATLLLNALQATFQHLYIIDPNAQHHTFLFPSLFPLAVPVTGGQPKLHSKQGPLHCPMLTKGS